MFSGTKYWIASKCNDIITKPTKAIQDIVVHAISSLCIRTGICAMADTIQYDTIRDTTMAYQLVRIGTMPTRCAIRSTTMQYESAVRANSIKYESMRTDRYSRLVCVDCP